MNEIHIASCVMHVRPEHVAALVQTIKTQEIAEVPVFDANGRIVVVLEGRSRDVVDAIERMRTLPGVIAINLVYQHAEDEQALEEPMS